MLIAFYRSSLHFRSFKDDEVGTSPFSRPLAFEGEPTTEHEILKGRLSTDPLV